MNYLNSFFRPRSIAIVGASEEPGKIGTIISKNLINLGYEGSIFFVNPKYQNLYEKKCYASLGDIPEAVDLAVIVIPAKFVENTILPVAKKIKNFVVISAGFGETDEEGKKREEALKKIVAQEKINILGPNCLGFMVPEIKLNASFAPAMPKAGTIGLISQSGALISAIVDKAQSEKIAFSHIVSVGNKISIDESELLNYFEEDESTKIIGMYLEGIKDGQKFLATASRVAKKKPIVLIKAGKGERAQKAIASHTGALAGSQKIMEAVCQKAGIIQVETLEEFFDAVNFISCNQTPINSQVAVVTNAGGVGVLATDAFEGLKVELFSFTDSQKAELKTFLPMESSVENPIDVLGDAQVDRYQKTLDFISKNSEIGTVVVILTPQAQTPVMEIAQAIIDFKKKTSHNLAAVFLGGEKVAEAKKVMAENGVAVFTFPEAVAKIIEKYWLWKINADKDMEKHPVASTERVAKAQSIIEKIKSQKRSALNFLEAKQIMDIYNIETIEAVSLSKENVNELPFGFPIVIKVDSDKVLHKTDKKGVYLNIKDSQEAIVTLEKLEESFAGMPMIAEPMRSRQTELILGLKRDPVFGPVVIFGLGGIYTEVFNIAELLVPPVFEKEVKSRLQEGKLGFLFKETRGQKPYDIDSIAKIILGVTELAQDLPDIKEMDINPLLAYNDGQKNVAVDVKIILKN